MHPVPILLGSNLNEGTLLIGGAGANLPINNSLTEAEYETFVLSYFGELGPEVLALYPASDYESPWWAVTYIITDEAMACPAQRTAQYAAKAGAPAFLYEFVHEIDWADLDPYLGVFMATTWRLPGCCVGSILHGRTTYLLFPSLCFPLNIRFKKTARPTGETLRPQAILTVLVYLIGLCPTSLLSPD